MVGCYAKIFNNFGISVEDKRVELFVGDVDVSVDELERNNIFAIAFIGVVRIADHMSKHELDVFFRILERI